MKKMEIEKIVTPTTSVIVPYVYAIMETIGMQIRTAIADTRWVMVFATSSPNVNFIESTPF